MKIRFILRALENDPNSNDDGFDDAADFLGFDKTQQFYSLEQDRRVQSNQMDAKLDYYYIINDVSNFNFVGGTILSRQNFDSRFFQFLDNGSTLDPDLMIPGFEDRLSTNDTEYNFTDLYGGARYRLKSGIFTLTPGFTLHSYNVNNNQYGSEAFKDTFVKFLPEFEMIMQFKRSENLRFSYRQQVNFTDVNQIAVGIVANSYNSFFFGNDDIQNAYTHNLRLNYYSFNLFNYTNIFASVNYVKTIDQIGSIANFIPGSVISTRSNLNLPFDTESFTTFGSISKTFKKVRTRFRANYNYSKSYQFIGSDTNEVKLNTYSFRPAINTNFIKAPNVSLQYNVSFQDQNRVNIDNGVTSEFSTVTHAPSISFDAYIWDALTVKTDYTFNEVRQDGSVQNMFKIWNFSMAYRKNRDAKWEYELKGSNLLGTDSEVRVTNGNISNVITNVYLTKINKSQSYL